MSENTAKVLSALIIDDEVQIRRLLRLILEANGFEVIDAATGQDGLVQAATRRPDVVLLDLGLPDLDGLVVLQRLREWSRVPVIVLSVRDREGTKVAALDNGADDYVTKPFGTAELLARLRVAQRHAQPGGGHGRIPGRRSRSRSRGPARYARRHRGAAHGDRVRVLAGCWFGTPARC